MADVSFGIDFGTTNTVVAKAVRGGSVEFLSLDPVRPGVVTHPSVLAFELDYDGHREKTVCETGLTAIELASRYPDDVRYIQSFKNHVASEKFEKTMIFSTKYGFPDLLATFFQHTELSNLLTDTSGETRIVIGRPVRFYGEAPNDALAMTRYRDAFRRLGVGGFSFALEPVGGALSFFRKLQASVTVLVADFGGGTSDFLVARFTRTPTGVTAQPLAHAGLGIAGDVFDYRIIQNVLLDQLGSNTTYISNGLKLPVPRSYYTAFSKWHLVTGLRTPRLLRDLKEIQKTAARPDQIQNLIGTIELNRGLAFFKAVSEAKANLSSRESARISIDLGQSRINEVISRSDFETWIADDLRQIEHTVDTVLHDAVIKETDIDRVFMTGGTSLVPAIQSIFHQRFGTDRVEAGDRFGSVAEGLALAGIEDDPGQWLI